MIYIELTCFNDNFQLKSEDKNKNPKYDDECIQTGSELISETPKTCLNLWDKWSMPITNSSMQEDLKQPEEINISTTSINDEEKELDQVNFDKIFNIFEFYLHFMIIS